MNLDWENIYNEASATEFGSGKKRFYDNRVSCINTGNEDGKFFVTAVLTGDKIYHTKIEFDEQGGLYDYECDCSNFQVEKGPCKHIVATALASESKYPSCSPLSPKAPAKPRSDASILSLISEYTKRKHQRRQNNDDEKVDLVPYFEMDDTQRISVRFMIGRNRKYILKDISDFVSCVQCGGYRRYGVELELAHNLESFTERARKLVSFLIRSYKEKQDFFKDSNFAPTYKDEMKLLHGDVDSLFDLYSGQNVEWGDSSAKDGIRLVVDKANALEPVITIVRSEGGYTLANNLPSFQIVSGKQYSYIVTDTKIFPVTDDFLNSTQTLLKTFNSFSRMFVAESDMSVFYNNVLATISDFVKLESGEIDLMAFEAPPLNIKMFLDQIENGVTAKLECNYDDIAVDILSDTPTDIVRDWESEGLFIELLKKYFSSYPTLIISDERELYQLMSKGITDLLSYGEVYMSQAVKRMKVKRPPRIRVGVRLESDLLEVNMSADDFTYDELQQILASYREKNKYVRLLDGSFVDLDDVSLGAISEILDITEPGENSLTMPTYYAPFLANELKEGFFTLDRDTSFKALISSLENAENADIEVPSSLKDILRNYQKTGYRWLKTLSGYNFGGVLADDMGLGKSLQIIALLLSGEKGTSIIVCPTTLILNWASEFVKFAPQLKILPIMGSYAERKDKIEEIDKVDVVITSYELIRRDDDLYSDFTFLYAIVDEAQYIKNPETKNSRAVKTLKAKYRFALTGTPIENSLAELWSIFDFVMPKYLYSYPKFKDIFESEVIKGNVEATERLKKLVRPFILRRLKSGVLKELPPKIETDIKSPLTGEQEKIYRANLALVKDSLEKQGKGVNSVVVLSMLTKLRQICCEPRLVYSDYQGNSEKLAICCELVANAVESGHKVLLFSQFTSMLDIIRGKLVEMGVTHYILKGDTPKAERIRLVNRFNADETQVFLISLKAGGTGLNLTGADVVIHYDPWWNESVMNQATDRAYRLGQNKSVQVYKLILENTIEEKILKLQEKKTALSSLVVGESSMGQGAKSMSYDEILEILAM